MLLLKPYKHHFNAQIAFNRLKHQNPTQAFHQARKAMNCGRRRRLMVRGCQGGEEKKSEKISFLSLEEAGLVEMSGLSAHERFLCRLTVDIIFESAESDIRARRLSNRRAQCRTDL